MRDLTSQETDILIAECRENLDEVEADLERIGEGRGNTSQAFVKRVFRAFHSIKGSIGYLHLDHLMELCQLSESLMAEVRDGQLQLTRAHVEVLLSATGRVRHMSESREPRAKVSVATELQHLNEILRRNDAAPSQSGMTQSARSLGLRALVVADDFSCRTLLQGQILKYGTCHIAVKGREAVEAFQDAQRAGQGYDLICMDIPMAEIDGWQTVEQIRKVRTQEGAYSSGVKIFIATSIQETRTILQSNKALCDAFLFKPIDGVQLEEHLRAFGLIGRIRC